MSLFKTKLAAFLILSIKFWKNEVIRTILEHTYSNDFDKEICIGFTLVILVSYNLLKCIQNVKCKMYSKYIQDTVTAKTRLRNSLKNLIFKLQS